MEDGCEAAKERGYGSRGEEWAHPEAGQEPPISGPADPGAPSSGVSRQGQLRAKQIFCRHQLNVRIAWSIKPSLGLYQLVKQSLWSSLLLLLAGGDCSMLQMSGGQAWLRPQWFKWDKTFPGLSLKSEAEQRGDHGHNSAGGIRPAPRLLLQEHLKPLQSPLQVPQTEPSQTEAVPIRKVRLGSYVHMSSNELDTNTTQVQQQRDSSVQQ